MMQEKDRYVPAGDERDRGEVRGSLGLKWTDIDF